MQSSLFIVLITLYISQGLPSGILAHVLPTVMADQGVAPHYIGMLKMLALPWALKFIWAPYIDRYGFSFLGTHRTWILLMQTTLACLVFLAALTEQSVLFGAMLIPFLFSVLLVNTAAATQDIATDGLAVRLLPERLRGIGNSIQVAGYKVGMILSSSLILLSVSYFGWEASFTGLAAILLLLMLPALILVPGLSKAGTQNLEEPQPIAPKESLYAVYKGFFSQPSMKLWLLVLLTYKLADSLGSAMIKPWLIDLGFDIADIAGLTFWSSLVGLLGAAVGGWAYLKLGRARILILAGLFQALSIGAYYFADVLHASWLGDGGIYLIALLEQFADGVSTVALFSLMMGQCRQGHEGSDFTVQASLQVVSAGIAAAIGGAVASLLSLQMVFVVAAVVGLLALIPVVLFNRTDAISVDTNRVDAKRVDPNDLPKA